MILFEQILFQEIVNLQTERAVQFSVVEHMKHGEQRETWTARYSSAPVEVFETQYLQHKEIRFSNYLTGTTKHIFKVF